MLNKQEFETHLKWELPVLTKVAAAIPANNFDYKPHEKSRSARELVTALIAEIYMTKAFLQGQSITTENAGSFYNGIATDTQEAAIASMETANKLFIEELEKSTEESLKQPVKFFHRDTTVEDAVFNMMLDLIHHRGQLSVYVRLAGGKVPSIYGPSADEEFTG